MYHYVDVQPCWHRAVIWLLVRGDLWNVLSETQPWFPGRPSRAFEEKLQLEAPSLRPSPQPPPQVGIVVDLGHGVGSYQRVRE